jgi:hypothetical protein
MIPPLRLVLRKKPALVDAGRMGKVIGRDGASIEQGRQSGGAVIG